jgi:hypothetical protein
MAEMKNLPRLTNPFIDLKGRGFSHIGDVQVSPQFTYSPAGSFASEAVSHETWTPLEGHAQRLDTIYSYSSFANEVFWANATPNSEGATSANPPEDDGEPKKRYLPFRDSNPVGIGMCMGR